MVKYVLKHTEVEVIRFSGTPEGYELVVAWLKKYEPRIDTHGCYNDGTMYYSFHTRDSRKTYTLNTGDILTVVPEVGVISIYDDRTFHLMHEQKISGWWHLVSEFFLAD